MVNGGKYNWRIAAQENVNNALEITPSTAVDGSTFSTPAVTILNTGNVGIGTVSPGGKLQVGTAGTQSAYTYGTGNGDGLLFNFYNDGSPYTRHADIVSSAADASAADIKFFTKAASANPLERVRIDSQGNVGIATTTPGYPLTVAGTIYSTTGGFRFPDATTQTTAYLGSSQTVTAGNVSSGAFGFPSASNAYAFPAALAIGTSTTTGLPANGLFVVGNVGIGTSTPSATLDVQSNHSSAKIAIFKQTHTSNGGAIVIDGPTDDDSRPSELFFNRAGTTKWVVGQEYNVAGFHFRTTAAVGNEKLTILESGNVGIGTTGPRRSLHIDPSTDVTTAFGAPLLQVGGDNSYAANGVFGIGIGYIDATNTISPTEIAYKVINGGAATFGDLIFGTRSVNTNTAPTERMRIQNDGNVGIATTTPGYPLTVAGTIYSTTGGFRFPDATTQTTAYLGSSQTVTAGNVSSGAFGFPSASNAYAFPAALAIGTSTTTGLPANGLFVVGNVGIGTTSPTQTLQVIGAQMGVFNSTTGKGVTINSNLTAGIVDIYSDFLGGSEPKLHLSSYTDRAGANGITIQSGGNVGIGTTGPSSLLHISAATPELRITATTPNTEGQLAFYENETVTWIIDAEKAGGFLNFNTYNGGSTATRVTFLDNGNVGIGTTTPITARLVIVPGAQPAIDVGSQKIIGLGYPAISTDAASVQYVSDAITNAVGGTSTSTGAYVLKSGDTMSGNLNMGGNNISGVNKLYVTTIDPVYQIGGVKYATYVSNTIGQKEEVYGKIKLELGIRNYEYTIDFNKVSVGSDLWLFWQTIAEGKNMKDIQVLLTPQFNGRAWYELKPAQKQIVVFGEPSNLEISKSRNLEISYHLVAPRHDASEWLNQIETNEKGIPLNVK